MRIQIDHNHGTDAILAAGEGDGAFDAWTLEELEDDLGSLRSALAEEDTSAG